MTGHRLSGKTAVLSTTTTFNILSLPEEKYAYIINLHKLNDIQNLDEFIDAVNKKLDHKGYFFCCVGSRIKGKQDFLEISTSPELDLLYAGFYYQRSPP
ncbi:MAG: hypothetical protein U0T33_11920 [Bacteroidales bacterium]